MMGRYMTFVNIRTLFIFSECDMFIFSECDMAQMSSSYGSYGSYSSTPHAFPPFQHPSHELLSDNGFVWHVYHKYHAKCMKGKNPPGIRGCLKESFSCPFVPN